MPLQAEQPFRQLTHARLAQSPRAGPEAELETLSASWRAAGASAAAAECSAEQQAAVAAEVRSSRRAGEPFRRSTAGAAVAAPADGTACKGPAPDVAPMKTFGCWQDAVSPPKAATADAGEAAHCGLPAFRLLSTAATWA